MLLKTEIYKSSHTTLELLSLLTEELEARGGDTRMVYQSLMIRQYHPNCDLESARDALKRVLFKRLRAVGCRVKEEGDRIVVVGSEEHKE